MIRPGKRRRYRDDHPAAARHQSAAAVHGDTVGGVLDQLDWDVEHDVVGDQGRQSPWDLTCAADEPGGLGAALRLSEQLRRYAAGLDGEQQMQEGHLGGGHREDPDRADLQQSAGDRRKPLRVIPGAGGDRVPLGGARCLPGRFDRNLGGQLRRAGAAPARAPSTPPRSGRETRSPAARQSRQARRTFRPCRTAGRSRPRVRPPAGTSVRGCRRSTARRVRSATPGMHFFGEDSSADALVGLQHQRLEPGIEHLSGGDHPRKPRPDDDDVRFMASLGVPWRPICSASVRVRRRNAGNSR